MPDTDLVKVYRRSTGEKLKHPVHRGDLRYNPDLAILPSKRAEGRSVVPDDTWTIADLTKHAAANQIDLAGATKKADILAAISQPSPAPGEQTQPTTEDPQPGSDNEKE